MIVLLFLDNHIYTWMNKVCFINGASPLSLLFKHHRMMLPLEHLDSWSLNRVLCESHNQLYGHYWLERCGFGAGGPWEELLFLDDKCTEFCPISISPGLVINESCRNLSNRGVGSSNITLPLLIFRDIYSPVVKALYIRG